jgi:hypothetical protein
MPPGRSAHSKTPPADYPLNSATLFGRRLVNFRTGYLPTMLAVADHADAG